MVMANIAAGMSVKRPGAEQYSSDGYHLTVETEAEIENADHFRAVTAALFAEVKQALEAEVAGAPSRAAGEKPVDLWNAGGNGGNGRKPTSRQDAPTETPPADRDRSHAAPAPISNKQAKYLWQLARKSGMRTQDQVGGWIAEKLGVEKGVYELSKTEASKAIDILNNGNGGASGGSRPGSTCRRHPTGCAPVARTEAPAARPTPRRSRPARPSPPRSRSPHSPTGGPS